MGGGDPVVDEQGSGGGYPVSSKTNRRVLSLALVLGVIVLMASKERD